jgi:CheY-like chemotaxis protein
MSAAEVNILVVDDDEGHGELVRRHLRRGGVSHPILTLTNGSMALNYIFGPGPAADRPGNADLLVLLDINMPGIDGFEVLRQIKADPTTRQIPVVMLTTTGDQREIKRCYQYGCSLCITKSVDPAEFVEAVRQHCDHIMENLS